MCEQGKANEYLHNYWVKHPPTQLDLKASSFKHHHLMNDDGV